MKSIADARRTRSYRLLEGAIGYISISFLVIIVTLAFVNRPLVSIFLILYSFMWVLKFCLNALYTIYIYKQLYRWESLDWETFLDSIAHHRDQAVVILENLREQFQSKIDWSRQIDSDIARLKAVEGTKYENPQNVQHIAIFSVYNEPAEVLLRTIELLNIPGWW